MFIIFYFEYKFMYFELKKVCEIIYILILGVEIIGFLIPMKYFYIIAIVCYVHVGLIKRSFRINFTSHFKLNK